ncbi:MAG: pyridoxamine 5'-phosphate oxidase family protein [Steroidobacteraceae bacterium]
MALDIPTPVLERLASEQLIWLTTAKADGMPLPNPVWFLWRDGGFLVLSMPGSVKVKNLERNPRLSLHFNSISEDGSDVAIFQCEGRIDSAPASAAEIKDYVAKYDAGLKYLGITEEALVEQYRPVRIEVLRYRTVTA